MSSIKMKEKIEEAILSIKNRQEGRYKLIYDKNRRTIIAVKNERYKGRKFGLNI